MGAENSFERQKGIDSKEQPKTETNIADLRAEKLKEKTEKVEEVLANLQVILDIEDPEIQKQAIQTLHTTLDSEAVNLAELKGKNLAVCAENV